MDYTGNVFWPPPTKFRSTCPVDVTYFPFDDQTCNLKLSSWMYDGTKVSGYWVEQYPTMWYSCHTNTVYFHIVRSGPSSLRRVWFSACHGLYSECQTCLCVLMVFICVHYSCLDPHWTSHKVLVYIVPIFDKNPTEYNILWDSFKVKTSPYCLCTCLNCIILCRNA